LVDDLGAWIGNREEVDDVITAWPIAALRATLDIEGAAVLNGTELDPLWHWLFFLPTTPRSRLGRDGHAELGGFLPPIPLPRRMYAGGRFDFSGSIRVGDSLRRTGSVVAITEKQGRSGRLFFVTVRFEIKAGSRIVLTEEQDLVYREVDQGGGSSVLDGGPLPVTPWQETMTADEVLLFRFSALTFNGHRIHYDHPFVTGAEGYPGLVVHGPLLALLLARLATERNGGGLRRFSFRAQAPVFCNEAFSLHGTPEGTGASLAVWSAGRGLAMTAQAEFAEPTSEGS
jgi:3-methylfumaryl-CoA hydratase